MADPDVPGTFAAMVPGSPARVGLSGFKKPELNDVYFLRLDKVVSNQPTFWNGDSTYFLYYVKKLHSWSVCGSESFEQAVRGASLGWAYQKNDGHLTQSCNWNEIEGQAFSTKTITVSPVYQAASASPAPAGPPPMGGGDAAAGSKRPSLLAEAVDMAAQKAAALAAASAAARHEAAASAATRHEAAASAATRHEGTRPRVREREGDSWQKWQQDRNVAARTESTSARASTTRAASAAEDSRGDSKPEASSKAGKAQKVDWAALRLPPFQRAFLPYIAVDPQDASLGRQALQIDVEEDPHGQGATPAPLKAFAEVHCLPQWLHSALQENAWHTPMPIQAQALPILLGGKNLIGIAQTGSGKTASFLIPAIVHIDAQPRLTRYSRGPVCLTLAPTRELAVQISDEATKLLKFSHASRQHPDGITSQVFYGGGRKWHQLRCFGSEGSHILVATPGRLLDFLGEGSISLQRVTYLVFDEADRMLDMGFAEDMKYVSSQVRPERQMAFFSATWPKAVQALACEFCQEAPVRIRVGGEAEDTTSDHGEEAVPKARESITQEVVVMDSEKSHWRQVEEEKLRRMKGHVEMAFNEDRESKVLIFVNEKGQVDKLSNDLWDLGYMSDGIHSGRRQDTRLEVLEAFRTGKTRVLVATDVIGRGLDIPGVSHVVIHSMGDVDDYVHRIGRTGRGKDGVGHALVFFEYYPNRPEVAGRLIGVLERAKQVVPPELRKIAEEVANGQRPVQLYSGRSWGRGGWRDRGGQEGGEKESGSWRGGRWRGESSWKEGWKQDAAGPGASWEGRS